MSRKNKTLRAFLHQNQNPTIKQAWDAAWKHAQKIFHARSMQDMEEKLAAVQAECEKLRACLAETAGVAVTMLYESHKADTIKEFTVEQLSQMVETTKHLADANVQVEKVYRKAWDMAHGCAGSYLEGAQP